MSDETVRILRSRIWAQYGSGVLTEYVIASDFDELVAALQRAYSVWSQYPGNTCIAADRMAEILSLALNKIESKK